MAKLGGPVLSAQSVGSTPFVEHDSSALDSRKRTVTDHLGIGLGDNPHEESRYSWREIARSTIVIYKSLAL